MDATWMQKTSLFKGVRVCHLPSAHTTLTTFLERMPSAFVDYIAGRNPGSPDPVISLCSLASAALGNRHRLPA